MLTLCLVVVFLCRSRPTPHDMQIFARHNALHCSDKNRKKVRNDFIYAAVSLGALGQWARGGVMSVNICISRAASSGSDLLGVDSSLSRAINKPSRKCINEFPAKFAV